MSATAAAAADPRTWRERYADARACRRVIRRHARSFSFAARFLPRADRADVAVVYAYYRRLDDLVDLASAGSGVAGVLDEWDAWLLAGAPFRSDDPLRRALPSVIDRRDLRVDDLRLVIRGLRSDLVHRRPESLGDVEAYAFDVAGSVGLVMASLLGAADLDRARPAAAALGTAMQLTNICRDVAEDLDRGRIYLPADVCAAAGATDGSLLARRSSPEVRTAVAAVADRARALYVEGVAGLPLLPRRARFPIAVAARAYAGILDRLAERDHDVFGGRAATTRAQRWRMAARLAAGQRAAR